MKSCLLIVTALLALARPAFAQDDDVKHWFMTELTCGEKPFAVRNYCAVQADSVVNRRCDEQELIVGKGTSKVVSLDTHQPNDDFLWVGSVRCGESEGQHYLYFLFDNGGNCDSCEVSATIDAEGRWVQFGNKWFTDKKTRRRLEQAQRKWFQSRAVNIKNKTLDTRQ